MRVRRGRGPLIVLSLASLIIVGLAVRAIRPTPRPLAEPPESRSLRLVLNLAARRLYVYENGKRTHNYVVSVGKPGHRTPTGRFRISRVIWNPWWHPPKSDWAKGKRATPPGPNNPMGRVKMYFRDLYYIHGTPHTSTLGQPVSHGCVRMYNKDAIALARLIMSYGAPKVSKATIDGLVASPKKTRTIGLQHGVPLQVISSAAAVDEDLLEIDGSADAMGEELVWEDAVEALAEAGIDMEELDQSRLQEVVREGMNGLTRVPIAELRARAHSESAHGPGVSTTSGASAAISE